MAHWPCSEIRTLKIKALAMLDFGFWSHADSAYGIRFRH
jgi:hypothetical protein